MHRFIFASVSRYVVGLLLTLAAAAALALPSPKEIESAVAAGHFSQAESMLREVIQEKPNSAKAHYELAQVLARQARYEQAQAALKEAQTLDSTLKFASSPEKFHELSEKIGQQVKAQTIGAIAPAPALSEPQHTVAKPVAALPESSFPMHYIWLIIAGLGVLALALRLRGSAAPAYPSAAPMPSAPGTPSPYGSGYAQSYPVAQPSAGIGSGIGGAVVGGLAGVAAGYALSKALEGEHTPGVSVPHAPVDNGYVPFENPPPADLGSFDAGSGSGWDDASSDSGSDDSW